MSAQVLNINKSVHVKKAQQIYNQVKQELEAHHRGEIVAIDPESGEYFLGKTVVEAVIKCQEKYPGTVFHSIRIGYPAVSFRK